MPGERGENTRYECIPRDNQCRLSHRSKVHSTQIRLAASLTLSGCEIDKAIFGDIFDRKANLIPMTNQHQFGTCATNMRYQITDWHNANRCYRVAPAFHQQP